MKKQAISIIIVILLSIVFISGCNEEKTPKNLVTKPVDTLALKLLDLPAGFSLLDEASGVSAPGFEEVPVQSYFVIFEGNYSNQTTEIHFGIYKFNNSGKASLNYDESVSYLLAFGGVKSINESLETIGDESKALLNEGSNTNYTIVYFRILNVVNFIMTNEDILFAIDFAKIVEQRINDSIR